MITESVLTIALLVSPKAGAALQLVKNTTVVAAAHNILKQLLISINAILLDGFISLLIYNNVICS